MASTQFPTGPAKPHAPCHARAENSAYVGSWRRDAGISIDMEYANICRWQMRRFGQSPLGCLLLPLWVSASMASRGLRPVDDVGRFIPSLPACDFACPQIDHPRPVAPPVKPTSVHQRLAGALTTQPMMLRLIGVLICFQPAAPALRTCLITSKNRPDARSWGRLIMLTTTVGAAEGISGFVPHLHLFDGISRTVTHGSCHRCPSTAELTH